MTSMEFAPDNRLLTGGLVGSDDPFSATLSRMALEPIPDAPAAPTPPGPGSPGPGSPGGVADIAAPALTKLSVKFAKRRGSLTVTSTEAGKMNAKITRARPGHKSKGECSTRAKKGKRCTAYVSYRSVSHSLKVGTQKISLGSKRFAVGRYRAALTATDAAGNASKPLTLNFSVKAR
jgi:hypothetical protein